MELIMNVSSLRHFDRNGDKMFCKHYPEMKSSKRTNLRMQEMYYLHCCCSIRTAVKISLCKSMKMQYKHNILHENNWCTI